MARISFILALLFSAFTAPVVAQQADDPAARQFLASLHPEGGSVTISQAKATLELGSDYIFYGPDDARRILTEAWGNPPESVDGVLGLVMPAGSSPLSETWGAVVTYEETGHVSDDDAADVDYGTILSDLKEASSSSNEERRNAGYPGVEVVGWAESPNYDKATHSVVWARDIKFDGAEGHTLNYDVRTLGRTGVLSLNLVSGMDQLPDIRLAARDFAQHASFDAGARYQDFDPSVDQEAEYGIGGLVAAGVGVATAKKLGIFALLAKFLKPILLGIALFFGAFWRKIKSLFGIKDPEVDQEWEAYAAPNPLEDQPAETVEDRPGND